MSVYSCDFLMMLLCIYNNSSRFTVLTYRGKHHHGTNSCNFLTFASNSNAFTTQFFAVISKC